MLKHVKTNIEEYYVDENGLKQGEYKAYYKNGQLQQICNYVDDKRHGEYKLYYSNGQIHKIYNYVNGRLHGEYKEYHEDGKVCLICNFVDDKRHGDYKYYYKNGDLYKHIFYHMGKPVDLRIHGMDIDNISKDDINLLMVIYA